MKKLYGKYLIKNLSKLLNFTLFNNELMVYTTFNQLTQVITFLKLHTNCQYNILSDLCVIDYPARENRFDVIYNLLSIQYNCRIKIKIIINELQSITSIVNIYKSANWWEREAWDMFGISFIDHPDLRRILTDYGFEGHPLRKDFPLLGFVELRYSDYNKRVLYEKIKMSQDFRSFYYDSPWQQT